MKSAKGGARLTTARSTHVIALVMAFVFKNLAGSRAFYMSSEKI